ncbi:MAG: thioredoxin, partial [Bacilli bacterium]
MIIELSNENINELVKDDKVLVDFYATWCGPCKMLSPVIHELVDKTGIKVIKIDIDKHEDIAREFNVMSVPTLIVFENGKALKTSSGFMPLELLERFIK